MYTRSPIANGTSDRLGGGAQAYGLLLGRRVASAVLAGLLALSPALVATPALAAAGDNGTITITKNSENGNVRYLGYKIFDATVADDGVTVSDVQWAGSDDSAKATMKAAVEGAIKGIEPGYAGTEAQDAALWINTHVTGTTATTVVNANSAAKAIANAVDDVAEKTTVTPGTPTTVTQGYWLFVTDPSTLAPDKTDVAGTAPIFAVVGSSAVTVDEKTTLPDVDKKIVSDADGSEGVVADSQLGQSVKYVLTGTVASNVAAYDTYYYEFQDSLSKGLSYDADSAKVFVVNGDSSQEVTGSFTIDASADATGDYAGGKVLSVKVSDLKTVKADDGSPVTIDANTTVRVEYTAKLTSSAVIGSTGNPDSVKLVYSNNPQSTSHGESTPHEVRDYAFRLQLKKVDDNTGRALSGVKFTIQATGADDTDSTDKYVQADGSLGSEAHEFATDDNGQIEVSGLDAGTYTVTETEAASAPDGGSYAKIDPFTVEIAPTYGSDSAAQTLTGLSATIAGDGSSSVEAGIDADGDGTIDAEDASEKEADAASGTVRMTVKNKMSIRLPLTGSQTMLLVAGAGLVVVTASVVALRRRGTDDEGEQE